MTKITLRDGFKSLSNSIITGSLRVSGSSSEDQAVYIHKSGSEVFAIDGSQGRLFTVTDSLSGSLFSVNDLTGIPILEVFSDDEIRLGTFNMEAVKIHGNWGEYTGSFSGSFQGDGSQLTGIGGGGFAVTNQGDNKIITATSTTDQGQAEDGLTFNGNTLIVTGEASASAFISTPGTLSIASGVCNWNTAANGYAELALTANITTFNITSHKKGGTYTLKVTQGSGGYAVTWPAAVKFPTYMTPSISTANGAVDIVSFVSDGTNLYAVIQNLFQ